VSIFFILGILTQIRDAAKKLEDFNQKLRQGAPPPFPQSSNRISPYHKYLKKIIWGRRQDS